MGRKEETMVRSLVRVYFPEKEMTFSYYNDEFDLRCGDIVYVEGKLEGMRGRVVDVAYNFKIRLSDYKRIISVADTTVTGNFYMGGSHFLCFDADGISAEKVRNWFKPPVDAEEYVVGTNGFSFSLSQMLEELSFEQKALEKGKEIFLSNQVVYLALDGGKGYAIVETDEAHEVEFEYRDDRVCNLVCDCFTIGTCQHELGALFQLRELLDVIFQRYREAYEKSGYFAALSKKEFFTFTVDGKSSGSIRI